MNCPVLEIKKPNCLNLTVTENNRFIFVMEGIVDIEGKPMNFEGYECEFAFSHSFYSPAIVKYDTSNGVYLKSGEFTINDMVSPPQITVQKKSTIMLDVDWFLETKTPQLVMNIWLINPFEHRTTYLETEITIKPSIK